MVIKLVYVVMDTCYIFLDSTANETYPNNNSSAFTVNFPKTEVFRGNWCVGLSSLTITGTQIIPKDLYISCDLVLESFVLKTYKRVLRRIILPESGFNENFNPVQYFGLDNTRVFDSIRITLLDSDNLKITSLQPGKVTCVLHFNQL